MTPDRFLRILGKVITATVLVALLALFCAFAIDSFRTFFEVAGVIS